MTVSVLIVDDQEPFRAPAPSLEATTEVAMIAAEASRNEGDPSVVFVHHLDGRGQSTPWSPNDSRQLMSTLAPTHPSHAMPMYTTVLAWLFVAVCVVGGAYEAAFGPSDAQPILAALILFAGAVLVAAGMFAARRNSPWLAVTLVTLGALVVGVVFFWTIVGVIIAIALIVLCVMDARRGSSVAARPAPG